MSDDVKFVSIISGVISVFIISVVCYNVSANRLKTQETLKAIEAGYTQRQVMQPGGVIWSKDPCVPMTIGGR